MAVYRKPGTHSKPSPSSPLDREDKFLAMLYGATTWLKGNPILVLVGVIGLTVIVGGAIYYNGFTDARDVTASIRLEELQQQIEFGDTAGVQADLELFLELYGGSSLAGEARVTLAQVIAEQGDHAAAAQILEPIARDIDDPLGAQAAVFLAAISEDAGNLETAVGLYLRLADRAELSFQVRDALADAARVRRRLGDDTGALALYDRLLQEADETDPQRGEWEMRRSEVATVVGR